MVFEEKSKEDSTQKGSSIIIYVLALFSTLIFTHTTLLIPDFLRSLQDGTYWRYALQFVFVRPSPFIIIADLLLLSTLAGTFLAIKKKKFLASWMGSFTYFLPTFLPFLAGMSAKFVGIEFLGYVIHYIYENYGVLISSTKIYYLGDIFLIPYWLLIKYSHQRYKIDWYGIRQVRDIYGTIFVGLGLLVMFMGIAAWLDGRLKGRELIKSGIYRVSRHPQYLGYILWGYGVLILSTHNQAPRPMPFQPTFNWFLSSLILIGIALFEEIDMRKANIDYAKYAGNVSFLIPVPKIIRCSVSNQFERIWKNEWPDTRRSVYITLVLIFLLCIIPNIIWYDYWGTFRVIFKQATF